MKPTGSHPDKALTAVKVRALSTPGRHADGNGLYLVVDKSGAKRWILRTVVHHRRRDIGLGSLRLVSLAEARDKAMQYRKIAREGGDPVAIRKQSQLVIPTFSEAARVVHAEHSCGWKNSKHVSQWINTLDTYAFPIIGDRPVDRIDTPDILKVLSPIWLTKAETARRVRQRIGTVLDWAKAAGYRSGENPVDGVSKGLPKQPDHHNHHEALGYEEVSAFIGKLRANPAGEVAKLAFEFLILTAARTGEVLEARWREIDFERRLWTIPAERMKTGREHKVPLADRTIALLHRARELNADGDLVFPGRSANRPMSNMVFLMILRRMKLTITVHGFRSAFRDWAAERTNFPREVCEMALAHSIKDKTEAAYRRGDLLEKRRRLMAAWAAYATSATAEIILLRRGQADA